MSLPKEDNEGDPKPLYSKTALVTNANVTGSRKKSFREVHFKPTGQAWKNPLPIRTCSLCDRPGHQRNNCPKVYNTIYKGTALMHNKTTNPDCKQVRVEYSKLLRDETVFYCEHIVEDVTIGRQNFSLTIPKRIKGVVIHNKYYLESIKDFGLNALGWIITVIHWIYQRIHIIHYIPFCIISTEVAVTSSSVS